jgi:hypothetical protein
MGPAMLADEIRQTGQFAGFDVALSLLILQVVDTDEGDCEPLVNRFKALQPKIGQAQPFFGIKVVDFHGPTTLIQSQSFLCRQAEVGIHKKLRVVITLIWR